MLEEQPSWDQQEMQLSYATEIQGAYWCFLFFFVSIGR